MKTTHIIILILIAVAIAVIVQYSGDLTTYETIASAKEKQGKFVNLIAKIDKTKAVEYDPVKNPNHNIFRKREPEDIIVGIGYCIGIKAGKIYHDMLA